MAERGGAGFVSVIKAGGGRLCRRRAAAALAAASAAGNVASDTADRVSGRLSRITAAGALCLGGCFGPVSCIARSKHITTLAASSSE